VTLRKELVKALIISFCLGVYQIWIQQAWTDYMVSQGRTVGVAEYTVGFFLVILTSLVISRVVTRRWDA